MSRATLEPARADLLRQVRAEIRRLTRAYATGAKFRPCLRCGEPFKPRSDGHVWCSPSCARKAHYLAFSVRQIRRS